MRLVKTSDTILQLRKDYDVWRRFLAETSDRGLISRAVDLLCQGKGDRLITETFTAYDLAEPEAQAWLNYFRQTGAIASKPVESKPLAILEVVKANAPVYCQTTLDSVVA